MLIFGYEFEHLDEGHIQDLLSLHREKAIYTDHWIDGLDDFRHVRIVLTDEEISEYARSMVAFDRFLGSSAQWAADVPEIPRDIAARADSYAMETRDGEVNGPPWHCAAAFMGEHLEELLCFNNSRVQVLEEQGVSAFLSAVRRIADGLTPAIRCFNSRESGLGSWAVTREDDVRDLLYVMLRGVVGDVRREEPIPSRADTSKVADLHSCVAKTLFEVKWVANRSQWKKTIDEIYVDIQTYGRHPDCRYLVFIIIDAARAIPDPRLVENQLSDEQVIEGKPIKVMVFVREP